MALSLSRPWAGMGLFALLLGVIVVSLVGSLIAADRALSEADRGAVALDASGAALVAQRELRLMEELLGEFATQYPPETPRPDATWLPTGIDHVWVLDAKRVARGPGLGAIDAPHDSVVAQVARGALGERLARLTLVRPAAAGRPAMLLMVPREVGAASTVAVGLVSGERLLSGVGNAPSREVSLALRAGAADIARVNRNPGRSIGYQASAPIAYAGDPIQLLIAHEGRATWLRTALWLLALVALAALGVAFWRERQNAVSLAGRTSELERLYQEVARSNRMKSEFLANVSHELRTPLNAVVGFVEMLREGVYGELTPRQALPVDRIAASATHLRQLVDRLLDIAKIAAGRLEVHPEPLILRPFVLNVASEIESLVSESGLALTIGVSPTLPRIRTDQTHLRQILINLIGNAVKYTPSGSISVDARLVGAGNGASPGADDRASDAVPPDPRRAWVALLVSDTGVGIAPADRERIFDEFEQVNAGARTDSARRGTGLGLAISRRLARLLGGELSVTSEVGKGSVFTVWLPVDSPDPRPAES